MMQIEYVCDASQRSGEFPTHGECTDVCSSLGFLRSNLELPGAKRVRSSSEPEPELGDPTGMLTIASLRLMTTSLAHTLVPSRLTDPTSSDPEH